MRACGCQLASSLAENHPKKIRETFGRIGNFTLKGSSCEDVDPFFLGGKSPENKPPNFTKKNQGSWNMRSTFPKKQGDNFWSGKSVKTANILSIKFHLLQSGAYNHPFQATKNWRLQCTTIVVKKVKNNHPATRPTPHTSTVPSLSWPERIQKHAETLKNGIRWRNSKSQPFLIVFYRERENVETQKLRSKEFWFPWFFLLMHPLIGHRLSKSVSSAFLLKAMRAMRGWYQEVSQSITTYYICTYTYTYTFLKYHLCIKRIHIITPTWTKHNLQQENQNPKSWNLEVKITTLSPNEHLQI